MADRQSNKKGIKFMGFPLPSQNYSKLPHKFIDYLPAIDSMAELKVVIYLLRHTWGFSEYGKPKKITTDEFMNGRKRRDGKRMDGGTGLAKGSVITGLEKAVEHGFILVETDDTDKARIEKYYSLNMSDVQDLDTEGQDLDSDGLKVEQRSEKETKGRNKKKDVSLSPEEIKTEGEKVDKYFGLLAKGKQHAWTGRETFLPQHLPLVDWYHGVTGQDCPKNKRAEWMKAVGAWAAAGLTVEDLQAAYDMDINWRKVFTSPNQLTEKAVALKAQKRAVPPRPAAPLDDWRQEVRL